jgi:hypothetical protein
MKNIGINIKGKIQDIPNSLTDNACSILTNSKSIIIDIRYEDVLDLKYFGTYGKFIK